MKFIRRLAIPSLWKAEVVCFFQTKFTVSTIAIVFNQKNEVLLFYHTYRNNPWGLPGGFIKKSEHPNQAIVREILEESNIRISKLKLSRIVLDKILNRLSIVFVTTSAKGTFRASKEVSASKYFPIYKLPKLPNKQAEIIKDSLQFLGRS
jgi:ADP-ribose pyrophosphatase YjhB (NUDIX family)